jgi:post-segregation antitoxin (ccd killing protein)
MPFALIPDGYSLKKVTKLQQKAVSDKRRHDNVTTVLNNPEIVKQIIITGVAFLAVREGKQALDELKDLGVNISKDAEEAFTRKRTFGVVPAGGVSLEDLVDEALKRIPFL